MIKPVIIKTNTNTGDIWHVKRGEGKKEMKWGVQEGEKE